MSLALLPYKGDNGGSSDAASPGDTNACRSPGKLMAKKSTDLLDKQESWDHRVNKTDVSILEGSPRRCPKPDRFAEIASEDLLQNALHQKLPGKRVPCGKCENCLKDDCGECWKCQFKQENNKSGGVCIRKICTNHQTSKPSVLEEASATEASSKKSRRHPCGSCENCLKEDCGQCNKCLHRAKGKPSRGVCVRRKCLNYQRSSSDAGSVSSSTSVRRNRSRRMVFPDPEEGDKVYAKWKENGDYYWGRVTKKFSIKSAVLFNILFDDGDKRNRTPRNELLSEGEFLNEFTEDYYRETTGMDPPKISPRGKRKAGLATHEMESEKKLKSEEKQQVFRHDLLGREILRQWVDRNLNERKLYGTVRKCFKDPLEESKYLDIEYSDESITVAQEIMPGWTLSKWEKGVPEEVAWGCRQAVLERRGEEAPAIEGVVRWIVPDNMRNVTEDDVPVYPPRRNLSLTVRGKTVRIKLKAARSGIPDAGLGVFIKVKPPIGTEVSEGGRFVLKKGEMIDLGVYGPLRETDVRDDVVVLVKSFLFDNKPEEWVFDSKEGCSKQCFDITNDVNGDLHNVAQQNILVFVNETDGKEQASVHARRDLFSHVHYLVGPGENDAELSIPYGEWTELKIDYGENYERVRIRKGYSRLSKDSPDRARMEGENLDSTTLHDTQYWCARETKISLDFLLNLDLKAMHSRPRVQTLVISLCLYNRLIVIKDEFEESEFVTLTHRVLDLVKKILKSEGVSDELLEETFKQSNAFGNAMHLAIFLDTTPDLIIHHVSAENIRNAIRSRLRVLRKETA